MTDNRESHIPVIHDQDVWTDPFDGDAVFCFRGDTVLRHSEFAPAMIVLDSRENGTQTRFAFQRAELDGLRRWTYRKANRDDADDVLHVMLVR